MSYLNKRLKNGCHIEFTNDREDGISIWYNETSCNYVLMCNAKVIKATRTLRPIQNKLVQLNAYEKL